MYPAFPTSRWAENSEDFLAILSARLGLPEEAFRPLGLGIKLRNPRKLDEQWVDRGPAWTWPEYDGRVRVVCIMRRFVDESVDKMVIGNRPEIARSLLAPAYSMASVIANEFSEASDELYLSALIEIGLALFIVTIIVNALARVLVWAVTRGAPVRGT